MPIAFPPPLRGEPWIQAANLGSAAAVSVQNGAKQFAPNFDSVDVAAPITRNTFGGVVSAVPRSKNGNLRALGRPYISIISNAVVNRSNLPYKSEALCDREFGFAFAKSFIAVTRDSAGAILPNATVYLMRQVDGVWTEIQRTVSDGSGNFRFDMMTEGPYWIPGYKVGSPDLAGASVNTLQPT